MCIQNFLYTARYDGRTAFWSELGKPASLTSQLAWMNICLSACFGASCGWQTEGLVQWEVPGASWISEEVA